MGLAASQARFLAITSRKMNCEFQSMQIAQQKLSVTRDLQKAAQDYQNSLSATKLVWDCDTVDNDVYDLTYDLMMNPSAINEYDAYLITDARGKIVLNNKMWNAAVAAGIINEKTGDPISENAFSEKGRNAFLDQLGVQGAAPSSVVESVKALGASGYTSSGVGGEVIDKTIASIMNTTAFINYMKNNKYEEDVKDKEGKTTIHKKGDYVYGINLAFNGTEKLGGVATQSGRTTIGFGKGDDNKYIISKNGSVVGASSSGSISLGDIITGKYALTFKGSNEDFVKIIEAVLKKVSAALGYDPNSPVPYTEKEACGLNATESANRALQTAYELTLEQMNSKDDFQSGDGNPSKNAEKSQDCNTGIGKDKTWSISLSNLVNSFLTNFAIAMEGFDCGLNIDKTSAKKSNYVSKYLNYNFQIVNDGYPEEAMLNADFYNQLYNQICMNGACNDAMKREMVMDKSYVANALKNAQLFVSTLNTDGYFYQGHYTASDHIGEVADDEAIARAEVEYNVTKSKLNHKEETLELQMKNLDMEISALSIEYDTVKGLISKGVEKVFTMFST